jgi:hypothetical protein
MVGNRSRDFRTEIRVVPWQAGAKGLSNVGLHAKQKTSEVKTLSRSDVDREKFRDERRVHIYILGK